MSARRVVWVSFAPVERTPQGLTSAVASVRYRITRTASALARLGVESTVTYLGPSVNRRTVLERFRGADAAVFGKLFTAPATIEPDLTHAIELIEQLRRQRTAVLADYSDDHFSDPILGPAYRALAGAVDRITASTPGMAEIVARYTTVPVSVITDLVEGRRGEPRVAERAHLRLLWFGHPTNLRTLGYGLLQMDRVKPHVPHSLTLLTTPAPEAKRCAAEAGARLRLWSTTALFEELGACDGVIIPSNQYDPLKAVKSPNRFAETVWAGRLALAHPLPAYEALAEGGWVGEDLGEGLKWYMANPAAALQRIRAGQAMVTARHSPEVVAASWKRVIEDSLVRP